MSPPITRIEIAASLAGRPTEYLWCVFSRHVQVLQAFWAATTDVFATRTNLLAERRDLHLRSIAGAFELMDAWRTRRVKYVKARRNEIDSAISFIRNTALNSKVSNLRIAPASRNAAGALRILLTTSYFGYRDEEIPELIASAIYDVAAVRTLFPFDVSDLTSYHPGHQVQPPLDPYVVMLESAGKAMGVSSEVNLLFDAVSRAWASFEFPEPIEFPVSTYEEIASNIASRVHYSAIRTFHDR